MSIIDAPTTLDALRDKDCLSAGNEVDRSAVIAAVVAELEANHVAHSLDEVGDAAVYVGQLTADIFGVDDPALSKLVAGLLGTGPSGKVQRALADGNMLCATRSKINVALPGGGQQAITLSTRFLSDDADTINAHLLVPMAKRATAVAERALDLGETVKSRRPEMAAQVDEWTGQLQITFQTALTSGTA